MPQGDDSTGVRMREDAVLEKWDGDPADGGVLVEVVHVRDGEVIEVTHPHVDPAEPFAVPVIERGPDDKLHTRTELHAPPGDSSMGVVIPSA